MNNYPQLIMGGISPGQKWWQTVLEHRNFMQPKPMGRLSVHSKCLDFFSFNFWVGLEDFFFLFSFVPNMFPSSSHQVPNVYPGQSGISHLLKASSSLEDQTWIEDLDQVRLKSWESNQLSGSISLISESKSLEHNWPLVTQWYQHASNVLSQASRV